MTKIEKFGLLAFITGIAIIVTDPSSASGVIVSVIGSLMFLFSGRKELV